MAKIHLDEYETYLEIIAELPQPISESGLDPETVKRLYESKIVYLENLRGKCFMDMNRGLGEVGFTIDDYQIVLRALSSTKQQLREAIKSAVEERLSKAV